MKKPGVSLLQPLRAFHITSYYYHSGLYESDIIILFNTIIY